MNANSYIVSRLESALDEISWYIRREKNLAEKADDGRTWAEHLADDLHLVREGLGAFNEQCATVEKSDE